jgi:hypothetical protein
MALYLHKKSSFTGTSNSLAGEIFSGENYAAKHLTTHTLGLLTIEHYWFSGFKNNGTTATIPNSLHGS